MELMAVKKNASGGLLSDAPPKVLAYVRTDGAADADIRARMLRHDGSEDAGTGSANCALMGVLAMLAPPSLMGQRVGTVAARILQGVEMGRPSELHGEADRLDPDAVNPAADNVGAVRIGGQCARVSRGELLGL